MSVLGDVDFLIADLPYGSPPSVSRWIMASLRVTKQMREDDYSSRNVPNNSLGFYGGRVASNAIDFNMPYWFPVTFFAALAGLPWYWRYIRFSLRTLLILFTIVAALLGYVAWAVRSVAGP
jgi:hypothetical protein